VLVPGSFSSLVEYLQYGQEPALEKGSAWVGSSYFGLLVSDEAKSLITLITIFKFIKLFSSPLALRQNELGRLSLANLSSLVEYLQ
jgi:hypothetical protein